ncbi:MAG: ABC transporter permease [Deltaproteobacteria bacterium]|nr:ABC transporter permease [Deltaproteobacteria bacterium]
MRAGGVVSAVLAPLALRHLARHRGLVAVTIAGLACGVASTSATQILYGASVRAYEATTLRFAGRAALLVSNGESGVPEELGDELRAVRGVRAVAPSVGGFVAAPEYGGERLYLYGVDLLADQQVRDDGAGAGAGAVVRDPMAFLAAPDSVALPRAFLRAHGLGMDDRLSVRTPSGAATLVVRAVLGAPAGPASALDGRLAIVDLPVAQELLRLDGRVSQLAIDVAEGADVRDVARRLAAEVGARGVVERPRGRAALFARLLASYRNGLALAAVVAVAVAACFVANVAAVACEERRAEMALLRLLGASGRLVGALLVTEMLVVALAATGIGAPLGLLLARLLQARYDAGAAALHGDVGGAPLVVDAAGAAASAGLGVALPLLAVVGALRRVRAVRPLDALRPEISRGRTRARRSGAWIGVAVVAAGLAVWTARERLPIGVEAAGMSAILAVLAGLASALPTLVRRLADAADASARRAGRGLPILAVRLVTEEGRRVAITCTALLVGIGGAIGIATWIASLDATLHDAFDAVFARVDLVVSGGAEPFAPTAVRMPGRVVEDLARLPEVAAVDALRVDTVAFEGSRAAIVARDAAPYVAGRRRLYMVEGDADEAARALASGTGVVVNRVFARRFGRRPGDEIALATPEGRLRLRIAGIHLELAPGDLGAVQLDRNLYRRWWRDDSVTLVEVAVRRPSDRTRVAAAIRARWGDEYGAIVFTVEQLRAAYRGMLDRLTALVGPLLAAALASAIAGVLSAGAAAMLARRRTHALLRAVGLTRSQLARTTSLELATIGAIAVGAGAILGWGLGRFQVEVVLRGMLGMSVRYAFPHRVAGSAAVAVLALTALGGWWLGRRAARRPLAEALRWE